MLTRIIDLSLRHRPVVLLLTALLVVTGLFALRALPFDAYPDTTPVQVTVNTVAPQLGPSEVERQLTYPLEQALIALPSLTEVRSISKFGFSQITVVFEDDVDIWQGRQQVAERLQAVSLPASASRPTLGPVSTGLGEVFQYIIESDERSPRELRTLHEWTVRPQMLATPGVAEVNTWGGFKKQFHVVVDPDRLLEYELSLAQVERALRRNNANAAGGFARAGGESQLIKGVALATSVQDIERIVVAATQGVPVLVSDVAQVQVGHEIRRGAVTAGGDGEVVLGLGFMLMGENSMEVTRALAERLDQAQKSLPDDVELRPVYNRADLVGEVLDTVRENLLAGALIVIAILFMLMGHLRAGLIVALAIPLSMLFAFNMMLQFGIAGSLMSLGAIDFGLVVDSSVIVVENAERRLAEDDSDRSVAEVVRDAAVEVRKPTLFGELIIAVVYLPILALEGVEGKLFAPMALTVVFALLGSMVISMTLMPVLASYALRRRAARARREPRLLSALKAAYRPVLDWAVARRKWVLVFAAFAVVNAGLLALGLGAQFVPRLQENSVVINTVRLAGVSLDESARYGTQIERKLLREFPDEIEHIWTRTGTAEVATDPMGLELSDVFITLHPRASWRRAEDRPELVSQMQASLRDMPGMRKIFTQPIEMRVNEMLAGIRSDVGIKLYGDDLDVLEATAEQARAAVEALPQATDVTVEQITGLPVLEVELDRQALARHGLPAEDVLRYVESLGARVVGEIHEGQRRFDLAMRLPESFRDHPERLQTLLITTADGQRVPLGQLADIGRVEAPSTIERDQGKRRIIVEANVVDGDLGGFVAALREALDAEVDLPDGYFFEIGGQYEHLQRAQERLFVVVPLALLLVFILLFVTYGQLRDTLRVFATLPFAAVGGILALWLREMPFSISAGVGFVALTGIAVLGDMVLVSCASDLRARSYEPLDAIRQAAMERLRPVLMTGLVAAAGFVPMALNTGLGAEVQRPLATVIIGGVFTSTIATLVVTPALYLLLSPGTSGGGGRIDADEAS